MKQTILLLAFLNAIAAISAAFLSRLAYSISLLAIAGDYQDLDTNGVIDHVRLRELHGDSFVNDWMVVVHHLVGEPLKDWSCVTIGLLAVFSPAIGTLRWLSLGNAWNLTGMLETSN